MRVLILGAGGMAGHLITIYFKEKGHEVVGYAKQELPYCETIIGNAIDDISIRDAINYKNFDAVINCIGILNKSADNNKIEAIYLNSYLPHYIQKCLAGSKTKLIHLSTDCVFSGDKGQYSEKSNTDSSLLYGMSKALGEIIDNKNLTIRTSIVGPDIKKSGMGLLNWFMAQKDVAKGFNSVVWTGISTITLAKAIEEAITQDISGLYHLVGDKTITKYELLRLFNKYIRNNKINILHDNEIHSDKSLINNRSDFKFVVPSYDTMVKEMADWIYGHKDLYSHYFEEEFN